MKSHLVLAGTVLLGVLNATGKERLMMQQVMIVTPRTAEALGLSYQSLWDALKLDNAIPHGTPIVVRLAAPVVEPVPVQAGTQPTASTPALSTKVATAAAIFHPGPVVTLPIEKAALAMDKNAFVRT